jgi:cell division septation protein DedD
MASDDQAGLEGQCPACGKVVMIPQEGTLAPEEADQGMPAEPLTGQDVVGDETSLDIKGFEDLDEDLAEDVRETPERRTWFWSSRFAVLGSIVVVVVVALIVFTLVRRDREGTQELVVIKEIEPLAESEREASAPPVGAKLEEDVLLPLEEQPSDSVMIEEEPVEAASTEATLEAEPETVTDEQEETEATVASIAPEIPSEESLPPIGAYTINIASFRQRENAERYVAELKQMGVDAFDWEVDLPGKGKWYRVSVGGFSTRQEAEDYASGLKQKGISDIFITQVPKTS